jgi:hypothetical protein
VLDDEYDDSGGEEREKELSVTMRESFMALSVSGVDIPDQSGSR